MAFGGPPEVVHGLTVGTKLAGRMPVGGSCVWAALAVPDGAVPAEGIWPDAGEIDSVGLLTVPWSWSFWTRDKACKAPELTGSRNIRRGLSAAGSELPVPLDARLTLLNPLGRIGRLPCLVR